MIKRFFPPIAICIILFSNSCTHKTDVASIREIFFGLDIQPIVAGNCTQSGCHNDRGDARFPLITYNDVISRGGVNASDARGSKFYKVISNHSGGRPMPPPPLPLLSSDQIKLVYIWIEQGAKNN